jgi:hypothetical protein
MPQTGAERQRSWRQRRAHRVSGLEAALAARDTALADLTRALEDAQAENERLRGPACRHPAEAVQGGTCQACGTDVW